MRVLCRCVLFGVLALWAVTVAATPLKITEVEGVSEYRLENGLRILLAPDPGQPSITVNLTYLVGSRHEKYGETGMAHLLEHLLFKGTPRHPDIPGEFSRRAMRPNGSTSYDFTNYYATFAADEAALDWLLGMEADRMVNAWVAEKDLRSEMTVVRNEMERGENSVSSVLRQKTLAAAYQWHNYGRTVIGARSDVENVRIENLQDFYRRYYQPDNAVLVISGRFDLARALSRIEAHFGVIPRPTRSLLPLYTVEPAQEGERYVRLERLGEKRLLDVVYHIPAGGHPDMVALELLLKVMADTPGGRLHKALVQRGLATAAGGWNEDLADPGHVFYRVQLRREDSADAARQQLLAVLEGVAAQPVSEAELARARRALQVELEKLLLDPERLAAALANAATVGDWRLLFWQRDQLAKVRVEDLNRVAQHYYRPANRTLGEFAPVAAPVRVTIPPTPDLGAQLRDYRGQAAVVQGEKLDPAPAALEARTQKGALGNGLQWALLPKRTRGQQVYVVFRLNWGDADSLREQATPSSFARALLLRGTRQHSREALAAELDRLRTRLAISGGGQQLVVSLETVREQLPAALGLLREILREPAFAEDEFRQLRQQARAGIEAARAEPEGKLGEAVGRHFNDYPPGDIRHNASFDEQLQALERLDLAAVRRFHARFYGANHAQFAAVGDFDVTQLTRQLEALFGDWNSPAPWRKLAHPFRAVPSAQQQLRTPDKQNAVFQAILRLPLGEAHPDYPALRVANRILGGGFISSRLADRLRQREGLSYSVGSDFSASRDEARGQLGAYAIYAPQFRNRVEQAFREELARALRDGFSEQEVKDAQQALLQSAELKRGEDARLAQMLVADLYHGQDFGRVAVQEAQLRRLSAAEVSAALRRHVRVEHFSLFFAGDFPERVSAR